MNALESYLKELIGLGPEHLALVSQFFVKESLDKNQLLVREGAYCKKLVFIQEGYLRFYTFTEKKDISHWIFWKGQIVTDVASFYMMEPAKWNIQALSDCEVYSISVNHYQELSETFPLWSRFEKQLFVRLLSVLEKRVYSFLSMSAEERYQYLYQAHPALFNEVPLNYLASMLGMSPETLSRIRKKQNS